MSDLKRGIFVCRESYESLMNYVVQCCKESTSRDILQKTCIVFIAAGTDFLESPL